MNINMDDDIRSNRSKFQSEQRTSMSKWVLIITIGVFLGTMASWATQKGIELLMVKIAISEMNKKVARQNEITQKRLEEQRRQSAAQAQQRKLENEQKQAGYRQAMETCNYWRDQYRKESSSNNKYQRDQSCNFVSQFR
ncbi:hypothetical protein [Methylophaga sp.]|uniref:hypothetical protein n=1 Tax=Methylophaga sp. TaxID=2024840 RepID=UPI003F696861